MSIFIMGIFIWLYTRWYILLLAILVFILRAFIPNIPIAIPLILLAIWIVWAIITSLKNRSSVLNMDSNDDLINKMLADNDKGYRNIVDAVNEVIDKNKTDS